MVPVGFFVVSTRRATCLDTGNSDKTSRSELLGAVHQTHEPGARPLAIDTQLKKIGLSPDDIKYVAVGHMHLDQAERLQVPKATFSSRRKR